MSEEEARRRLVPSRYRMSNANGQLRSANARAAAMTISEPANATRLPASQPIFFGVRGSQNFASVHLVDLAVTYDLGQLPGTQVFMNVTNILNRDPELVAYGPAGTAYGNPSTNQGLYDILGRVYRAGVRFRY